MVGANHNDNKPAHGKTFDASKTGADQTRGLISTLAAHYSLGKALHSIIISRHMGKPFDVNKKGPDQTRGLIRSAKLGVDEYEISPIFDTKYFIDFFTG